MARKGKAPRAEPSAPVARPDMSTEERRKRLIGLGMTTEEVDRQLAVTDQLDANELGTAPTAVCTAHVPSDEHPDRCANCGKPLAIPDRAEWAKTAFTDDEWKDISAEAEARQSEKRFDTDDENAAYHKRGRDVEPVKMTERAIDDGPSYTPTTKGYQLDALWAMRLSILAKEAELSERDYLEMLVRRQWVARGKGKS